MADKDNSFFYSVRSLSGATPETQTNCIDILRTSDFEERSFTQNEIETELDAFCGGHNILVNTDFHYPIKISAATSAFPYSYIGSVADSEEQDASMKTYFNWFSSQSTKQNSTTGVMSNSAIYDLSKPWTYGSGIHLKPLDIGIDDSIGAARESTFIGQVVCAPNQQGNFEKITPFTLYTASAYVKKMGTHEDVISIMVNFVEKEVQTSVKTVSTTRYDRKGRRTTSTTTQTDENLVGVRKTHFSTFDLDAGTCVLKSEDCLADIEYDAATEFYRISLTFITFTPSLVDHITYKIFVTNEARNFLGQEVVFGANGLIDDTQTDAKEANANWLENNYPSRYNKFVNQHITEFIRMGAQDMYVPNYNWPEGTIDSKAGEMNDGFAIFAPQMNIGESVQRYGENDITTVTHNNKYSCGDAVVTRFYDQLDTTPLRADRTHDFITPFTEPEDKLNNCPFMCEVGRINRINGYASPKFNGSEYLYMPAFEVTGDAGAGYFKKSYIGPNQQRGFQFEDYTFAEFHDATYDNPTLDENYGWHPKSPYEAENLGFNKQEYVEVILDNVEAVDAIIMQGRSNSTQYVKTFKFSYSTDGVNFIEVGDTFTSYDDRRTLQGLVVAENSSTHRDNKITIPIEPVEAIRLRVYPQTWYGQPSFRMGVRHTRSYSSLLNLKEKFAMNIAYASVENDYGQGSYDEVNGKFSQNFSKAQLLGTYNFGEDTNINLHSFKEEQLSGTFFFGVDRNQPTFRIYGGDRYFSSTQLQTTTASWDDAILAAEGVFGNSFYSNLLEGATGTRLAVMDDLEKCQLGDELYTSFNATASNLDALWIGLRQTSDKDTTLLGWEWINGEKHNPNAAGTDELDPAFWHSSQPGRADYDYAFLYRNLTNYVWGNGPESNIYNYVVERMGVDTEIKFSETIDFNVSVATIVRDDDNLIRGYFNGKLCHQYSDVNDACSIRMDRDFFLGRAGSGERFAKTLKRRADILARTSGHENFGTGFEGFFLELNIAKETGGHAFLDTYDNLANKESLQTKVDYNINKNFQTRYVGSYSTFTADTTASNTSENKILKAFGNDLEVIYNGDWDGTFKYGWTDNPVWILYDLMTSQRYGIGNQIDNIRDIDVFSLYSIGKYCDAVDEDGMFSGVSDLFGGLEPRYSTNIIMNQQENAYNTISNIASTFFGLTYWENGTFNFSLDQPKEPMCVFSNQNVFDGQFDYGDLSKSTRFTRVKVNFMDKRDEYKQKAEFVEDLEATKKYGLIEKEINALGCTSRGQARRYGKHILYSNLIETETISFTAGQEALLLSPGDVFKVEDELKNFEINYGKIKGKNIAPLSIEIDKTINTGSILLGESGGIYVYNHSEQNEIEKIYDMIVFDKSETFNNIQNSGEITQEIIDGISRPQVSKLEIQSIEELKSTYKIILGDSTNSSLVTEKIKIGSPYSIKMSERRDNFYKVVKISEDSKNIYAVQGLQHEPEKFNIIEGEEDFDPSENNFEIGIPSNEINRPPVPDNVSFTTGLNSIGKIDLTGVIQGASLGNETKYRVSLYRPNGSYATKEFEKGDGNPPLTNFEFRDVVGFGEHAIEVTSLRNPESSTTFRKTFKYQPKISEIKQVLHIDIVSASGASFNEYTNLSGFKVRDEEVFDKNFLFFLQIKDSYSNDINFSNKTQPKYDISLNTGSDSILVKENINSNGCILNRSEIESLVSTDQRNIDFKFELKNSEQTGIIDTFYLKTKNEPPNIEQVSFLSGVKNQVALSAKLPEEDKDINRFDIFTGVSGEFEYFHSQNRLYKTTKEKIIMSKDLFATESGYETGLLDFRVVPVDDIGTGYAYPEFSANLNLE